MFLGFTVSGTFRQRGYYLRCLHIRLFVCMSAGLHKNYTTDFSHNSVKVSQWPEKKTRHSAISDKPRDAFRGQSI